MFIARRLSRAGHRCTPVRDRVAPERAALVTVGSDMSGGVVARTLREAGIKRFARGHADDA